MTNDHDSSDSDQRRHSHFWIWLCLIGLMCGWSTCDYSSREGRIDELERRIKRLERSDAGQP